MKKSQYFLNKVMKKYENLKSPTSLKYLIYIL
nr:MAG TPA: hypothetical protein [Caudoviricetes sp.]